MYWNVVYQLWWLLLKGKRLCSYESGPIIIPTYPRIWIINPPSLSFPRKNIWTLGCVMFVKCNFTSCLIMRHCFATTIKQLEYIWSLTWCTCILRNDARGFFLFSVPAACLSVQITQCSGRSCLVRIINNNDLQWSIELCGS